MASIFKSLFFYLILISLINMLCNLLFLRELVLGFAFQFSQPSMSENGLNNN